MKYKVTLTISYMTTEFLFDDRLEALDFMDTAWLHRNKGSEYTLRKSPELKIIEEEETNEKDSE